MSNRINNSINNRINNKSNQGYTGIIFFVFLVLVGFAGYTFYKYFYKSFMMQGYSYLTDDLKNIEYLFQHDGVSKDECLDNCKKDYLCRGLTYDATQNVCYGLREGKLRSDDPHIFGWVKDMSGAQYDDNDNMLVAWTKIYKEIPKRNIPIANFVNKYAINFWFRIDDWYHNYALWRNIIYQGDKLEREDLTASTWGDIIKNIPKQRYGVWLAPYTNNIRITVGTKIPFNVSASEEHPANQICTNKNCYIKHNESKTDYYFDQEFIDIKNIDVGIPNMITIVFEDKSLGIYHNGKMTQNLYLSGSPVPLNTDCYIKLDKSYDGPFINYRVWTDPISSAQINELYKTELQYILTNEPSNNSTD